MVPELLNINSIFFSDDGNQGKGCSIQKTSGGGEPQGAARGERTAGGGGGEQTAGESKAAGSGGGEQTGGGGEKTDPILGVS